MEIIDGRKDCEKISKHKIKYLAMKKETKIEGLLSQITNTKERYEKVDKNECIPNVKIQ